MTRFEAGELTRLVWDAQRPAMIQWLINAKRFNPKAAERAIRSFIDTIVFVAEETGEPQIKRHI